VASSSENLMLGLEFRRKCNDLHKWKDGFIEKTQNKFDSFMNRLEKKVNNGIYDFAERNYANENAGEAWKEYLKRDIDIEGECKRFIQEINKDFKRKQRELMDDMQSDLHYAGVSIPTGDIAGEGVIDTQSLAQIGLAIATILGPVGWVAGGIGLLLTFLFESKEEKIQKQKKALRDKLEEAMGEVVPKIGDKVLEVLNDKILNKGVNGLLKTLDERDDMMMELADEESSMAYEMAGELTAQNAYLWQEAEEYLGLSSNKIYNIAKVPGKCIYAFGQKKYSKDDLNALSKLLLGMGDLNYKQIKEEEKDKPYFVETARELFMNNIEVDSIDYGEDGKIYVYNVPDFKIDDLRNKWEYSVIQQIEPLPVM